MEDALKIMQCYLEGDDLMNGADNLLFKLIRKLIKKEKKRKCDNNVANKG